MTIEEMQSVWSEMTKKLETQEHLTNKLIMDMTKEKFKNKISRIARYESAGAIICFIMAVLIILNINKLDTWYFLTSGLIISAYLIIIPLIVLKYIKNMKTIDLVNNTYKESLVEFARRRKQFLFWQRLVIVSNFFLMIFILPVSSKLLKGKDLFTEGGNVWLYYIFVMLVFLIPFSIWGYRSYKRMTASAEILLHDLQS